MAFTSLGRPSMAGVAVLFQSCTLLLAVEIDFDSQIKPLLSNACFRCHGPDPEHRHGGFRVDTQEGAFTETKSGAVPIVPGNADQSELIARITSPDPDLRMPPPNSQPQLSVDEIETLTEWISQGAPWKVHWSLQSPMQPEVPSVVNSTWARSELDHFIYARLQDEGLTPSAESDAATLLRRLSLDLTGLPPTLEELEAFLLDDHSLAYERQVDRLLASPRFGEHMARYWLEAVRYGDTHGKHLDNYREIWPYRDWVVRALNQNMAFDQFVIEQLAGDLLPEPTLDQLIATGFNRCNVTTSEGGSIKEEVYVSNVIDRVGAFGTIFLGLTLECTRCHDHKYDPLTMEDYYSLFGFFNNIDGEPLDGNKKDHAPVIKAPTPNQQRKISALSSRIAECEQRLRAKWPELDSRQQAWQDKLRKELAAPDSEATIALGEWHHVGPFSDAVRYLIATDFKHHGPEGKPIELDAKYPTEAGEELTWKRRSDWCDNIVARDLPGESVANFVYRTIESPERLKVSVELSTDDGYRLYLNGRLISSRITEQSLPLTPETIELDLQQGRNELLIKLVNISGSSEFSLRFLDRSTESSVLKRLLAESTVELNDDRALLMEIYRLRYAKADFLSEVRQELKRLRTQLADLDRQIPTTLIWKERAERRPTYLLLRGAYDKRGKLLNARTPLSLPVFGAEPPNDRLELARWLLSPQHPLTARVTVNRFWQQVFGRGLVETSDDFGSQGSPPSHPQLLDWLATDFVEHGWDVKRLMRQLVTSATYRQSSEVSGEQLSADPKNLLLARASRYRLDGEVIRDQALQVSRLLVQELGGPGVKPPQPDGLWQAVGYTGSNTVTFAADTEPEKIHRRTLYTFIKRTALPPQMSTFDSPSRESCSVRRERTNTPLQALLLMNDPQYLEAAQALADRVLQAEDDPAARVATMFRLCTCRSPTPEELKELLAFVQQELQTASNVPQASTHLVALDDGRPGSAVNEHELHAYQLLANLLLNLDEVLCKN